MSDKYYKPILKDGDHLVRSSKNPNRVRGQSRDADNKNPDIVEWEEVEIEKEAPEKSCEELEYELYELRRIVKEERAKQEEAPSTLDTFNLVSECLTEFLNDNPEVAEAIITGGRKIKDTIFGGVKSTVSGVKSLFSGLKKTKAETVRTTAREIVQLEETDIIGNPVIINENECEEMSIDEVRSLIIRILDNYVSMKRDIDRLTKAKINDVNMPKLDMDQVLAYIDSIAEKYPALMDKKTSLSVFNILNTNANTFENEKIMEALRIKQ